MQLYEKKQKQKQNKTKKRKKRKEKKKTKLNLKKANHNNIHKVSLNLCKVQKSIFLRYIHKKTVKKNKEMITKSDYL